METLRPIKQVILDFFDIKTMDKDEQVIKEFLTVFDSLDVDLLTDKQTREVLYQNANKVCALDMKQGFLIKLFESNPKVKSALETVIETPLEDLIKTKNEYQLDRFLSSTKIVGF